MRLYILLLPIVVDPDVRWLLLLDEAERVRCSRIRNRADRQAYAAVHALRRLALAEMTGVEPALVQFRYASNGAPHPVLPSIQEAPACSLSHTHDAVTVAVGRAGALGVDIEVRDRTNISSEMLRHGLGEADATKLLALPTSERIAGFYDLWTVKEAVSKAEGRGRALGFGRIRLVADDCAVVEPENCESERKWRIWRSRPSERHFIALAADAINIKPEVRTLGAEDLSAWCAEISKMY